MYRKKSFMIIGFIFFAVVIVINRVNIYKCYIKLLNESVIIQNYNDKGEKNGEYIAYLYGKPFFETNYENGKINGWATKYFENGPIKNKSFYAKGILQGLECEFYKDGKLNYKANWKNNKHYGNEYHYLQNGNLFNYDCFDIDDVFYYSEYDNLGNRKKGFGTIISPNVYSLDRRDSTIAIKNNESYKDIKDLYITFATPPNLKPQITVTINNKIATVYETKDNTIKISNAFSKEGGYSIMVVGNLIAPPNKVIRKDTLKISLVKE